MCHDMIFETKTIRALLWNIIKLVKKYTTHLYLRSDLFLMEQKHDKLFYEICYKTIILLCSINYGQYTYIVSTTISFL